MANAGSVSEQHRLLIREAAIACDLGEHAARLEALARPSVVLATTRTKSSAIPIGVTKVGGMPDVPDGFEWPFWNRVPLTFVAQVNLAEIAPFQIGLPPSGLLLFFFCFERGMETTHERSDGAGVVLLVQSTALHRCEPPKRAADPFRSCGVRLVAHPSLPPPYCDRVEELWDAHVLADDSYAAIIHHIDEALGIDKLPTHAASNYHQLLGYPRPVQYTPVEIGMQRALSRARVPALGGHSWWEGWRSFFTSGAPDTRPAAPSDSAVPIDLARCREWQLLMMFREDEYAGIRLIDSGHCYFMYPQGEFRDGKFGDVWTAVDYG
jgi:hypothetical protein